MPIAQKQPTLEQELARVNKEMYERNTELSLRNRTLSILRRMYEIINTTFTLEETATKLTAAIVEELDIRKASIALVNKKAKVLRAIATFPTDLPTETVVQMLGAPFNQLTIPLDQKDNFCIKCLDDRTTRLTNNLFDVLTPLTNEKTALQLQEKLGIASSILYPIISGTQRKGVLILNLDKHIGQLSRAQRETLRELIDVVGIAVEKAQTYEDLQHANTRLRELDKLKDEFISITSHELRTPMTAIKSYVWMIINGKRGTIPSSATDDLRRVYISTERLITLVNDMLHVSRIETGRIQMSPSVFDLVRLSNLVVQELQAKAAEDHITLTVQTQTPTIPPVFADREKMHQVLENLIGNALKFTPSDGHVSVVLSTTDALVHCAITDTGTGIAKEDFSKLFTKFGRLDHAALKRSTSGGTGLGLYISKQFVELSKGKIAVSSELGRGSTFTISLPVAKEIK